MFRKEGHILDTSQLLIGTHELSTIQYLDHYGQHCTPIIVLLWTTRAQTKNLNKMSYALNNFDQTKRKKGIKLCLHIHIPIRKKVRTAFYNKVINILSLMEY